MLIFFAWSALFDKFCHLIWWKNVLGCFFERLQHHLTTNILCVQKRKICILMPIRHSSLSHVKHCMNAFSIRPTFATIIMMNSLSDMLLQNAFKMKNTLDTISIKRTVCDLHISHVDIVLKSYYFIICLRTVSKHNLALETLLLRLLMLS